MQANARPQHPLRTRAGPHAAASRPCGVSRCGRWPIRSWRDPVRSSSLALALLGWACLITAPSAQAHVVLARKAAPAASYYRAQFMVGHGCEGSSTVAVQVDIPDGVPVVRPQPKAGWTLSYQTGPLAEPAMVHGKAKTEAIRRVTWTGGPLPDEQYEEFGMLLYLAKPGRLHFRVLQSCEQGANDWAGVAVEGGPKPAFPAATLDVVDPHAEHGKYHHGTHHPREDTRHQHTPAPAGGSAPSHDHHQHAH